MRAHTDSPAERVKDDCARLVEKHELACSLDVPDAAAPLEILADLQRRSVCVSMTLKAPGDKQRASSRINWVLRQLSKAQPTDLHVRAIWPGRTPETQAPLENLRDNPSLIESENKSVVPSRFEVLLIRDLAGKFSGSKTFLEQLEEVVPHFYEQVGQHLRAYVAPPPRLRREIQQEGALEPQVETSRGQFSSSTNPSVVEPAASSGLGEGLAQPIDDGDVPTQPGASYEGGNQTQ